MQVRLIGDNLNELKRAAEAVAKALDTEWQLMSSTALRLDPDRSVILAFERITR